MFLCLFLLCDQEHCRLSCRIIIVSSHFRWMQTNKTPKSRSPARPMLFIMLCVCVCAHGAFIYFLSNNISSVWRWGHSIFRSIRSKSICRREKKITEIQLIIIELSSHCLDNTVHGGSGQWTPNALHSARRPIFQRVWNDCILFVSRLKS